MFPCNKPKTNLVVATYSAFRAFHPWITLFTATTTGILICAEPTYKYHVSYGFFMQIMLTVLYFLNIGAVLNYLDKSLIPPEWSHRINLGKMPKLRAATQQPSNMDDRKLLHVLLVPSDPWSGSSLSLTLLLICYLVPRSSVFLSVESSFLNEKSYATTPIS